MNKICTDLSQSKKLLELGIDIDTADMHYHYDLDFDELEHIPTITEEEPKEHFVLFPKDIPAWSLSALWELIPDIVEDYVLRIDKVDGEYFIWYDKIGEGWSDAIAHPSSKNFIDAVFEMVVWLKKNNKI